MVQNASLQPAPTADATQQQDASALQTRVDQLLIELDSKTQEVRNVSHARAILASELELASGVQIKGEARLQAELEELREDLDTKSQVVTALQAELGAKADELQDARTELEAVLRSSVDKQATESGLLVARNASLQAELAAKSNELQLAGEEYANLEALTRSASDEQAASEEQLLVQITQLQHENQVDTESSHDASGSMGYNCCSCSGCPHAAPNTSACIDVAMGKVIMHAIVHQVHVTLRLRLMIVQLSQISLMALKLSDICDS